MKAQKRIFARSAQKRINNQRKTETLISMSEMITGKRKRRSARQMPDDIGKCKQKKTEKRKMEQEQKRKRKEEKQKQEAEIM